MRGTYVENKSPLSAQPLGNCRSGWRLSCTEQAADKGLLLTPSHALLQVVQQGSEQKQLNKQPHIPARKAKR